MSFVEREVGVKRKSFSLIEPRLGILERKELSLAAPLTMEHPHQVWLSTLARIKIDFNRLKARHQSRPWVWSSAVSVFATETRLGARSFAVIPASCSFRPSSSSTAKSAK